MLKHHAQRLGQIGNEREGVPGIDRQRGQDREDLIVESADGLGALRFGQIGPRQQTNAVLLQGGLDLLRKAGGLIGQHRRHRLANRRQLLNGRQTVQRTRHHTGGNLTLQTAHPLHEELVEVRREDAQKAHALQQRRPLVECFVQHPPVELQPAQLSVDEQLGPVRPIVMPRRSHRVPRAA